MKEFGFCNKVDPKKTLFIIWLVLKDLMMMFGC